MAELTAHGLGVSLPGGWDGRIAVRADDDVVPVLEAGVAVRGRLRARPVMHLATFGLPEDRGDFGSGAVELMGDDDVLVVLFEHEPASAFTALFRTVGMPRALTADDFDPATLRRGIPGQSAHQSFFSESGRPFCLYVVLGSHARRRALLPRVNAVLRTIRADGDG
jgi:hypothetical protein